RRPEEVNLTCLHGLGILQISCAGDTLEIYLPLIDFVLMMTGITDDLSAGKNASFEDTESDAHLNFVLSGKDVTISADFQDWSCRIPLDSLRTIIAKLAQDVTDDLLRKVPAMPNVPEYVAARK